MKIAIVHNLYDGGALNLLISITKSLISSNKIDIFSLNNSKIDLLRKISTNYFSYKLSTTNNIFSHLYQVFSELPQLNKKIAQKINTNNYDLILIFPCILTQSPYILQYLSKDLKTFYLFTEPKREFYEITSFDYYSIKRFLSRILRLPIKFIDIKNCRSAQNIISLSYYEQNILHKVYKKSSYVIHPFLSEISPIKIKKINNHKFLSVGALSKIKGHDFSLKILKNLSNKITILGRETKDTGHIFRYAKQNSIKINLIKTENDDKKNLLFKKFSLYLANQENEPFGISTLEAADSDCYLCGRNIGGTSEIIKHGLNGILLPEDINISNKILKTIEKNKYLNFYKTCKIDVSDTISKILKIYNYIYAN
jgi:glycosyltransferase involved in cell wall biosynthesis